MAIERGSVCNDSFFTATYSENILFSYMSFSNLPITVEGLPEVQAIPFKPIHRDYLKVLRISWFIFFFLLLAGCAALIFFIDELQTTLIIAITAGAYLLILFTTIIIGTASFNRKEFAVREKDILYRTGWIFQNLHMVPFNRMQHCVVNMGPIERKFGLASVSLYTAASEGKDITIHGLTQTEAEQLKELIMQQIQSLTNEEGI